MFQSTTPVRALSQTELLNAFFNISLTLKIFFFINTPWSIMLAIMLARTLSQIQFLNALLNVFPTLETFFITNLPWSTILASAPANILLLIKLPKSPSILLALETFSTNARLILNLNDRPKTRKLLQIISSNIWQK